MKGLTPNCDLCYTGHMTPLQKTLSNTAGISRTTLRQVEILTLCKARPRTIQQLADHFNMGYYTVRNDVVFLEQIGQLKASAFGSGSKAVLWETTESFVTKGLRFHTLKASLTVDQLVTVFKDLRGRPITKKCRAVAGALIALHYRATKQSEGFDNVGIPVVHLRRIILETHKALKDMLSVVEQILSAPIWDENADALTLLKALEEVPDYHKLISDLDVMYQNEYEPLFELEDSAKKKST